MIVRARRAAGVLTSTVLASAVVLATAGCSGSSKPAAHRASSGTTAASSSSAGGATRGAGPAPAGTGAPADAATKQLVSTAYATFFDPKSSAARSEAALQHGPAFAAALDAAAKTSQAQGVSAHVSAVNLVHADLAYVTFTLTSGGSALLPGATGYAVRENGTWKVAAQTFCNLLQLQGTAPPACKDPTITALPS